MRLFLAQIEQQLEQFSAYSDLQTTVVSSDLFSLKEGKVSFFLNEIRQTAQQLSQQTNSVYAEFYADRLVKQFDALKKAIKYLEKSVAMPTLFHSSYRFPRSVHSLPPERRLIEYRKALRALNEKLVWLTEAIYAEPVEQNRERLQATLAETEWRKQRCLVAIDELEK